MKTELSHIYLENVTKKFGNTTAVDDVNLSIEKGEIFSVLGPSGCGKTTTLRIIAGLLNPDTGRVYVKNEDITEMPPEKRNLAMVFQDYALWPHMTVFDNIAFGLKLKKKERGEITKTVKQVLELVKLEGFEARYPTQLSGGQQQRVALARALALNPQAILFDEPLSNLDAKLREELRYELKTLLKSVGITAVYVTHDQLEAFTVSDRIAIMRNGRIVQIGSPKEIYEEPRDRFVAGFIGESSLLDGDVVNISGDYVDVKINGGQTVRARRPRNGELSVGQEVNLILRPESLKIAEKENRNTVKSTVVRVTYLGDRVEYHLSLAGGMVKCRYSGEKTVGSGAEVLVEFIPEKIVIVGK
ncbi:MAG: ABC transporter ATP-binding protein [Candidatus Caldarchaeum sp.]|nr:ABC transporter ATP-binding protein [Candidatus Caldarchaeum sp.]